MTQQQIPSRDFFEERLARDATDVTVWFEYLRSLAMTFSAAGQQADSAAEAINTTTFPSDQFREINIVFERAVRALPGSFKLWDWYLSERIFQLKRFQQHHHQHQEDAAAVDNILSLFERASSALGHSMLSIFERWFDFALAHRRFVLAAAVLQLGVKSLVHHAVAARDGFVRHCASALAAPTPLVLELLRFNNNVLMASSSSGGDRGRGNIQQQKPRPPPLNARRVAQIIENIISRGDVLEAAQAAMEATPTTSAAADSSNKSGGDGAKFKWAPQLDAARRQRQALFLPIVARALDAIDSSNFKQQRETVVDVCKQFIGTIWAQQLDQVQMQQQYQQQGSSSFYSRDYATTVVSVASCLCRIGEIQLGGEILEASFQHAKSDEEVQTLHVCAVAFHKEMDASSASSSSSSSSQFDLSPEGLRRQVAAWRTVRDPTSAANWLELISLTPNPDDALFQRAISACTSAVPQQQHGGASSTSFTRTTHLFLAYARWLETQGRVHAAVELLKRASAVQPAGAAGAAGGGGVWLHSDKVALLRAAAELLLRTSSSLDTVLDFVAWACDACAAAIAVTAAAVVTPLWSLRVELALATGNLDHAVSLCWQALKRGSCSTKLILVMCDALVKKLVEQEEEEEENQQHLHLEDASSSSSAETQLDTAARLLHNALQLEGRRVKENLAVGNIDGAKASSSNSFVLYSAACYLFGAVAISSVHLNRRIELIRHVHKSALSSGCFDTLATAAENNSTTTATTTSTASPYTAAAFFSIAMLEEQYGTLHNSFSALRQFAQIQVGILVASSSPERDSTNKKINRKALSGHDDQDDAANKIDEILSFYLRRVAQVTPAAQLSTQVEVVMRQLDLGTLLRFGMQIVKLQLGSATLERNGAGRGGKDAARNSLRALAELEDPDTDESGVWNTWLELEVAENNAVGFGELQRLKRSVINQREADATVFVEER